MQNPSYDYRAKICVMGSTNIGKTAMIKGYCTNQYSKAPENPTVGLEIRTKNLIVREKVVNLEIWDTAGLERFEEIIYLYFRGMNGFILVYSIVKIDTFSDLQTILNALEERGYKESPKILVGTNLELDEYNPEKEDQQLSRMISYDEAEEFAEKNGMLYYEVSTRNGKNISQAFESLVNIFVEEWESQKKKNILGQFFRLRNPRNHGGGSQSKCASCGL